MKRVPTLASVAARVGDALRKRRIKAVLTGGACASLYSRGAWVSMDADFVLSGSVDQADLDQAMSDAGFTRRGDRYVHPRLPYYVEFPRGPLAVGSDHRIKPVLRRHGRHQTLALSPTDACRDRLAAFYHWNDRQSLEVAVEIARQQSVNMRRVREWSRAEDALEGFAEFQARIASLRRRRRLHRSG